ncbi:hypothetical protein P7K49_029137 [Saguinus oedipus]|uniref:Uncharacterized protein n=1 Tax=Saguinus oedipus TaxID=9490 RepID=A0ABQ9U6C2_SAGOE|nr:hypothetical protein P7K49_029137 [Saguinus oedipus]
MEHLEVSTPAQTSSAVSTNTDGNIHTDLIGGTRDAHPKDDVDKYLKLANSAGKKQVVHIKQVSEKNPKSSQTIFQLQNKLEDYDWTFQKVEQQPKDIFRDMHQGLKATGAKLIGFSESVVDDVRVDFLASPGPLIQ